MAVESTSVVRDGRSGYKRRMKTWNLTEIDTPNGTRSPVVLHSEDEQARAVLIVLDPGQELGDHEVREAAFVTVIEGSLSVELGNETFAGEPGTLFYFDPHERHSITSEGGARILLFLAKWPAADHYEAGEQELAKRSS
jgi:quercetin dioxygenase-like cupin family protein